MNHYLLPHAPRGTENSDRYGDTAYETLLLEMLRAGANKESLFAKVFGGSSIVSDRRTEELPIGTINWQLAIERLNADGISILETDVGGTDARKITFQTADGSVVVKKLIMAIR